MSDPQKPPDNYSGMHILAKLIGAACNLNCDYCFYLEKYKIEEGKTFNCIMRLITQGTCAPALFELSDINIIDYFETKR